MRKMKNLAIAAHTNMMLWNAGVRPERKVKKEGGSNLIEYLGLIIVAVVILFLFREQLKKIFENIVNSVSGELNKMFPDGGGAAAGGGE